MLNMFKKDKKNEKFNRAIAQYPCYDYLKNALRFLRQGQSDVAYSEICCAIKRAGGELSEEDIAHWNPSRKESNDD